MSTVSDTLRKALWDSGLSVRRLSINTGINRETINRFLHGENMTIHNADKLAALMGYELRPIATPEKHKLKGA